MDAVFLTEIRIRHVRHLADITIPLSGDRRKSLILTGENSSGKTSVLDALAGLLRDLAEDRPREADGTDDVEVELTSLPAMRELYRQGRFLLACFDDTRQMEAKAAAPVGTRRTLPRYRMEDEPAADLVRYLVERKAAQAFAAVEGDMDRADAVGEWFDWFQGVLRLLYADPSLTLEFDPGAFRFSIHAAGRDPFDLGTMSMGYAAAFEIVADLIMRMEAQGSRDLEGIVLIDEIEAHLHADLQKRIVPLLMELFPNVQFLLTTHSPFVLSSAPDTVVYDLEDRVLAPDGLTGLPYDGIVEGFFQAGLMSRDLEEKFRRYRDLAGREGLSDAEQAELASLEMDLDEVPSYLAPAWRAEYDRIKLELDARG